MKYLLAIGFILCACTLKAQGKPDPVGTVLPARRTSVHDPVMIKQGAVYYLFCTGFGISVFSSPDLKK